MQNGEIISKSEPVSFDNTLRAFSAQSDFDLRKRRLMFFLMKQEIPTKIGTFLLKAAIKFHLPVNFFIRSTLYELFCGGEKLDDVSQLITNLKGYKVKTILDYGLEAGSSEDKYDYAFKKIMETIDFAASQKGTVYADFKITSIAHFNVLEKVQTGVKLTQEEYKHIEEVKSKLDKIGSACHAKNVPIMVDAEETWIQGAIDTLVYSLMIKYNRSKPIIYNTIQMYRTEGLILLEDALALAKSEGFYLGVKLVRGAYMDKERERAKELKMPSPILASKDESDASFDAGLEFAVDNRDRMAICCGSHNEKSCHLLMELMEKWKLPKDDERFLFSQLYGMSDHITYNLAAAGYNVAKYIPYGPVDDVVPYLLRRADENKSIAGQTGRELSLIETELKRRRKAGELLQLQTKGHDA